MNKKPGKSGPKVRITRSLTKHKKVDDSPSLLSLQHEDRSYIYHCQYCRLKFTQNSQFFRHMTTNHEIQQKEATFQCNECKIVFSKKNNLDLHCQTHHQVKSKSKCESCAITFKSRYCLQRHLKMKQILQENACLKCHKKFLSKEKLSKHVSNKHMYKNIMYQCDMCLLKFKAKQSLQTHLHRIHKRL